MLVGIFRIEGSLGQNCPRREFALFLRSKLKVNSNGSFYIKLNCMIPAVEQGQSGSPVWKHSGENWSPIQISLSCMCCFDREPGVPMRTKFQSRPSKSEKFPVRPRKYFVWKRSERKKAPMNSRCGSVKPKECDNKEGRSCNWTPNNPLVRNALARHSPDSRHRRN